MSEEQCCRRSLVGSLLDSAKRAIADPVPIPAAAQEERMALCRACSSFDGTTCKRCGCVMSIKVKFAEMECPLNKWGKHDRGGGAAT